MGYGFIIEDQMGGKQFLKFSTPAGQTKERQFINSPEQFMQYLAKSGCDVPKIFLNNNGQIISNTNDLQLTALPSELQNCKITLQECVEGQSLPYQVIKDNQIETYFQYVEQIGSKVAHMHKVQEQHPPKNINIPPDKETATQAKETLEEIFGRNLSELQGSVENIKSNHHRRQKLFTQIKGVIDQFEQKKITIAEFESGFASILNVDINNEIIKSLASTLSLPESENNTKRKNGMKSFIESQISNSELSLLANKIESGMVQDIMERSERIEQLQTQIQKLPQGICHGDLSTLNIMQKDGKVIKIIDFDEMHQGAYIKDLVELQSNCFAIDTRGYPMKTNLDKEASINTLKSYESIRPLTSEEKELLPTLLEERLLLYSARRLKAQEKLMSQELSPVELFTTQITPEAHITLMYSQAQQIEEFKDNLFSSLQNYWQILEKPNPIKELTGQLMKSGVSIEEVPQYKRVTTSSLLKAGKLQEAMDHDSKFADVVKQQNKDKKNEFNR